MRRDHRDQTSDGFTGAGGPAMDDRLAGRQMERQASNEDAYPHAYLLSR